MGLIDDFLLQRRAAPKKKIDHVPETAYAGCMRADTGVWGHFCMNMGFCCNQTKSNKIALGGGWLL